MNNMILWPLSSQPILWCELKEEQAKFREVTLSELKKQLSRGSIYHLLFKDYVWLK
ncbi:hypothetical protein QFZ77_007452 [Paenibacillus sp. V4I3]|uniref:hypothetical protein n=1 Tax=Paenibacillus sp. V4I3 TaxID=3042305 RepID=UPI00278ACBF4|nr:hypothetical protein [Paenibacillus sp. V4I3]MDQ0878793.1 hypothetical protein [Paenibacillus sp. V4I3]